MGTEDPYDKIRQLNPELAARLKAKKAQSQAEEARRNEEYARTFKPREFVYGAYRTPEGRIDPKSDVFTIALWSDDYGNTVYIKKGSKEDYLPEPQIRTLSEKIQAQQAALSSLDPAEQIKIRTASTSPGDQPDSRFSDYLRNAALAAQFQQLKKK